MKLRILHEAQVEAVVLMAREQYTAQQGSETARNAPKGQYEKSRNAKENGRLRELATCHDVSVVDISGGHGGRTRNPLLGN